MHRIMLFIVCLSCLIGFKCLAAEIDYNSCRSLGEVIAKETVEIEKTSNTDFAELAHLHVLRGESYMLAGSYEEALRDIKDAYAFGRKCDDRETLVEVAINGSFCEVIIYDKLGMAQECNAALMNFQAAANLIGCNGCPDCTDIFQNSSNTIHFRDLIKNCKSKSEKSNKSTKADDPNDFSDIVGPDVNDPEWCEETVAGTATLMMAIANKIGNFAVKVCVIATIDGLKERGLKCCRAGGFWKACVAPIARKWKKLKTDWENRIIRDGYLLDPVGGHPYGF